MSGIAGVLNCRAECPWEWDKAPGFTAGKGEIYMDTKKVIKYTVITLLLAWTIQIAASVIGNNIGGTAGTMLFRGGLAVCMFMPLIAAIIAKADFKGMGWKPKFKGNLKWIVFALLVPVTLTILGFVLFFAIWPELFSLDGSYLLKTVEEMGMDPAEYKAALEQTGMSMTGLTLISIIPCITYAPFMNMFLAIGEEAGWRGFLYPELNKKFGKVTTWLIGGVAWAVFHFPAMLLAGYEYGTDYIGAPVLGLVVFTLFCISMGVIHGIIYDKTKCIWFPALLHGSVNAGVTLYQMVLNGERIDDINRHLIFGPAYNGLVSIIPVVILAVVMAVIVLKDRKNTQAG